MSERYPKTPWWQFRLWHGMRAGVWFRLLARHRFAIEPRRLPVLVLITAASLVHTVRAALQEMIFGRRIAAEPLPEPVFIIGHWRSGTTLLHELLATDSRFLFPTTLECFCPDALLMPTRVIRRLGFMIPRLRPMDNMPLGFELPQEDEFALMNMGVRSPYELFAFPSSRLPESFLRTGDLPGDQKERWKNSLVTFLKRVALQRRRERARTGNAGPPPRWLLLKSPPHTARIGVLRELFPNARFIHLARHPYQLFASTMRMTERICASQACGPQPVPGPGQLPYAALVVDQLNALYRSFDVDHANTPAGRVFELKYEDLVADPIGSLASIYGALGLGEFNPQDETLAASLEVRRSHRPGRHALDEAEAQLVRRRWAWYFMRFGYSTGGQPLAH